jgi:SAM-dependent methyltransferase
VDTPVTDPYEVDWAEHAGRLGAAAGDEREWYAAAAAALVRPGDRVALDVGCGGGGMAAALAAALEPGSVVVAADGSEEVLAEARRRLAAEPGLRARVVPVVADLADGVERLRAAATGPADLVWASASVHHLGDQQAAVTALAGLLGAGGRLALAEGGLRVRHLPWDLGVGEPGLEVRLDAAQDRWFAGMRARLPGSVPMPYGWTEALRRAGLSEVTTRTTLLERPAPLPAADGDRAVHGLAHRVDRLRPAGLLDPADLAAWERLLDPADAAFLGRRDDLAWLEARSVHLGTRRP